MTGWKTVFSFLAVSLSILLMCTGVPVCSGQDAGGVQGTAALQAGKSCEESLQEADSRYYGKKYDEAIPLYDNLIDGKMSCPDDLKGEAYYGRGRTKEALQDYRGAAADYSKSLQMNPDSRKYRDALGNGHYLLGNQKERLGDLRGAMEDYQRALRYKPESSETMNGLAGLYYERGVAKEQRGELKGAMEEFNTALKYRPGHPEAREAKRNLEERLRHKAAERDGIFTF
jgi:tetratricopeptide (TPR) repeat protein